jgi:Phage capsid protein
MSEQISNSFVAQFEAEVHAAYQRMGSKLTNTVRKKNNVKGSSTTFQKVGKGSAGTKTRHGNVPTLSLDHTPVAVTLADYYAADYVDKLDELKIEHDERAVVSQAIAGAMGRKSDQILFEVMDACTNVTTEGGTVGLVTAASRSKVETVFETFGNNDVPDDGDRYAQIAPSAWIDLLTQASFADADYVGSDDLPFKGGMVAKRWLSFLWTVHTGVPTSSTTIRKNFFYHRSAVAFASGSEVKTEMNYVPEKVAHLITAYLSQGGALVDNSGIYEVQSYGAVSFSGGEG